MLRRVLNATALTLLPLSYVLASGVAHAGDANQAQIFYQKGNAAYRDGDDVMARHYYEKSIEFEETFSAVCNLGVAEARSRLLPEAYEHLLLCLHLYPDDAEFTEQKKKFLDLRDKVRSEITFEEAHPIDEKVDAEIRRREGGDEEAEAAEGPTSPQAEGGAPPEGETRPSKGARLPVTISVGALGVVGLGIGTALLVAGGGKDRKADSIRSELEEGDVSCVDPAIDGRCGELATAVRKSQNLHNAGVVTVIGGGVAVVGAVALYLLWPEKKTAETAALSVRPLVGGWEEGGFQLGLEGRF